MNGTGDSHFGQPIAASPALPVFAKRRMTAALLWALPGIMAAFFGCWALRSGSCSSPVTTDAARHAMNGAFIYDLCATGNLTAPVEYAKRYYARLPALSLPFHPPLFPAIEAVFFTFFGVNTFAARLTVAVATALAVLLFWKLLMSTHASRALAFSCTATFFSLKACQSLSGDVMLELPALMFALAALLQLRGLGEGHPQRRSLALFALLAAAAVWTKQYTAFLGLVPFLLIGISGRWAMLRSVPLWAASAVLGLLILLLAVLNNSAMPHGVLAHFTVESALHGTWSPLASIQRNAVFYGRFVLKTLGLVPTVFVILTAVLLLSEAARRKLSPPGNGLYLAWGLAAFAQVLVCFVRDGRYLFFGLPALVVIGFVGAFRLCGRLLGKQYAWVVPVGAAAALFVLHLGQPACYLTGPSTVARLVQPDGSSVRILYCGEETDGAFIFAVRSLQPTGEPSATVVLGTKLPESVFQPARCEEFAHRYGIRFIVLQCGPKASPWDVLRTSPAPSMAFLQSVPLQCFPMKLEDAELFVYRFTDPSPEPQNRLAVPVRKLGGTVELEF